MTGGNERSSNACATVNVHRSILGDSYGVGLLAEYIFYKQEAPTEPKEPRGVSR
jgi:hypothetical protein